MRLILLASAATLISGAALAQSLLGQNSPGQSANSVTPTVVVPPPPAVVAAPPTPVQAPTQAPPAPPPGLVQTPLPPPDSDTNADNGDQTTQMQAVSPAAPPPVAGNAAPASSTATAAAPAQDVPPTPPNNWVPGKTAELGVLDKVDGGTRTLTIPVGGQATVGDLTVSVQACVTRPPGQLPDSAVFLTLQPKGAQDGAPVYRGWMVHSAPGATDAGNAGEAFRVITCS